MIRKLRKHFLKLFIAWVVITTAIVFFVLRSEYVADKAHNYLRAYLEEKLQSKVEMGRPEIQWIRGSWFIKDISIRPHFGKEKTPFVAVKSLRITFFPWWNVLKREIRIGSVQLEEPSVYIRIENRKVANLPSLDFLKKPKGLFSFGIREIRVSGGSLNVNYPEKPMNLTFDGIMLKVRPDLDKKRYGFILSNSSADIKVKQFAHKIMSMRGDFSIGRESLTVIKSKFRLPEGNVSAEGLYLNFAKGEWITKLSSELDLADVINVADSQWPAIKKKVRDVNGRVILSAVLKGDRKGFELNGDVKSEEFEMEGFRIRNTSSNFSSKGRWDSIREAPFSVELSSRMPLELLNHYIEKSPRLKGPVDIHVKSSSSGGAGSGVDNLKIEGYAASPGFEAVGIPVAKSYVRFVADRERASIKEFTADLMGGTANGSLDIELKENKSFKGSIHLEAVSPGEIAHWLQYSDKSAGAAKELLKIGGGISGDFDFTGGLQPVAVNVFSSFIVHDLTLSRDTFSTRFPRSAVSAEVSYDGKSTTVTSLEIKSSASAVSMSGDITDGRLSIMLNIDSSDLTDFGGYLKGAGRAKGRLAGTLNSLSVDGDLFLTKISWGAYSVDSISGHMAYKDTVFSSSGVRITKGRSELNIKGEYSQADEAPNVNLAFELKKGSMEDAASFAGVDVPVKGELFAGGKVKGRLRTLDGHLEVRAQDIVVSGEDIGTLNISARLEKGRVILDKGELLMNGKGATFAGEIGPDGDSNIRIDSAPIYLAAVPYIKKKGIPLTGTMELVGEVTGNIKNPSFRGTANLKGVMYSDISLGSGNVALSLLDRRLIIAGNAFGTEISGEIALRDNKPYRMRISASDLSLTPYFKGIERLEGVSGTLSGNLEVTGELADPKNTFAKGRITEFQLVRDPFFIKNAEDIRVELVDGRIMFRSFHLTGKGTEIDVSGWAGISGESSLFVSGTLDLYLLQIFTGVIDKGDGIADVSLTVSGRPPRIEGNIAVKDGIIGFKGFQYLISDISSAIILKGESLIVESLSGRIAEGRVKGNGTIQMDGLSLKRTDISLDLSGLHLAYPRWLPSEVEGSLRLSGDYPSLLLSGDMNVIRARYGEKVDWRTFLPSFKRRLEEPVTLREGGGTLKVDINFKADRNLIFENNLGRAELKGEVRLKGDAAKLGIVGDIEVISGKVLYKEHEFKIVSGVIEFPDPKKTDAVLDFTAEGKVRDSLEDKDYDIQIVVQGNINDIKVTMTSDPELSELDIASLISLGMTSKGFQESGSGASAYGAASLLTAEFEEQFKDYIGFERFHIDPYYSKVTGTTEPKLTVGKEISEDTFVIYSRGLSGTGEQEAQIEYKLFGNFSLVGGWSSFGATEEGDLGADFKFRFEFK